MLCSTYRVVLLGFPETCQDTGAYCTALDGTVASALWFVCGDVSWCSCFGAVRALCADWVLFGSPPCHLFLFCLFPFLPLGMWGLSGFLILASPGLLSGRALVGSIPTAVRVPCSVFASGSFRPWLRWDIEPFPSVEGGAAESHTHGFE